MHIKRPEPHIKLPASAKLVFKGEIFDTYQWEQELFDGSTDTFERLSRHDSVNAFPVLPDGRILMIKQEQPAAGVYMAEVAGRVEKGEEPLAAMKRELLEETGYEATEWQFWSAHQPVRKIDWAVYTFVAKGLTKVAEQSLDAGEKIELWPVSFEEFLSTVLQHGLLGGPALVEVCEALRNPAKMEELRKMFSPN